MKLTDAVANRHLVQWFDNGFVRTLEPHAFALAAGGRNILIAYQVAGGPAFEDHQCWKVIDAGEALQVDAVEHFAEPRAIPEHLQALVRATYACSLPGAGGFAVPRR